MTKSISFFVLLVSLIISSIAFVKAPAKNPHGKLKIDCKQCHTTATWKIDTAKIPFRHNRTGFILRGSHRMVKCMSCHESLVFSHVGSSCVDCHLDVHRGQLGINCSDCHSSVSWENRSKIFEQHNTSSFPLLGMHSITDCEACHVNQQQNEFANTPTDCEFCHQPEMARTVNPNHKAKGLTADCQRCHMPTAVAWDRATFQHQSPFIDRGAHASLECTACHSENFAEISSDCFFCHEDNYNNTTEPAHAVFGILTDCVLCHNEVRWEDALFKHLERANFELRGAHAKARCGQCHKNNKVTNLPRDCFGCHATDFNAVADPSHKTNNFDHECLQCHTEFVWTPSTFDHNNTQFPLIGAHRTVDCIGCHTTDYRISLPQDCFSCHETDFTGVTDPNHLDNNFDHDCLVCHDQSKWTPAFYDHNNTRFPLLGAHKNAACADCHVQGYSNTATDCFSCHQPDFNAVKDPNHVSNKFDHDCTVCHDQNKWTPATFDHNTTQFPLTGGHANVPCADCHANGYANTAMDCNACHKPDYDKTTNPNHRAASFPTTCEDCHKTTRWEDTTWDHDNQYFPIYSGKHRNEWKTCLDCHRDPNNFQTFSCIDCHAHNKAKMDDKHRGERGYAWESAACLNCHPQGKE